MTGKGKAAPYDVALLEDLSFGELKAAWGRHTSKPLPRVSAGLLRLALAWELQASVSGGISRTTRQRLDQLAMDKTTTRPARPGMRLVREWNGTVHQVTIGEDGVISWQGKEWRSLSEVARAITGTRWSGPAFFGLKQKKVAA